MDFSVAWNKNYVIASFKICFSVCQHSQHGHSHSFLLVFSLTARQLKYLPCRNLSAGGGGGGLWGWSRLQRQLIKARDRLCFVTSSCRYSKPIIIESFANTLIIFFTMVASDYLESSTKSASLAGIRYCTSQSRQSARLFLQSSELGPPHPSPRRRVCYPSFGSGGRDTLACGRGGGGSQLGRGDRHCGSLGVYVLSAGTSGLCNG